MEPLPDMSQVALMAADDYHRLKDSLEDSIQDLEIHASILDKTQKKRLRKLMGVVEKESSLVDLDINEINRQYALFLKMQEQVLADGGRILETASVKDIGTVITSMNNLISLFIRANKDIGRMEDESKLKHAVLEAIREIPPEAQAKFFEVLDGTH